MVNYSYICSTHSLNSFVEWLVDFDYTRVPVGDYIPDYGSGKIYLRQHLLLYLSFNSSPWHQESSIPG